LVIHTHMHILFVLICLVSTVHAEEISVKEFYSIPEINNQQLSFGTFWTQGFIIHQYYCSDCVGDDCKPCQADYIVVSQEEEIVRRQNLTYKELIIFVDDAQRFEIGDKYKFLIQITDAKTTPQIINNVKLIYEEKIEEGFK